MALQKIAGQILKANFYRVIYGNYYLFPPTIFHLVQKVCWGRGIGLRHPYVCAGLTSLQSQHFDCEDGNCTGCRNVSQCKQPPYSGLRPARRSFSMYY